MHALSLIYTSALIADALASPVASQGDDNESQKRICPNLEVAERGGM